MPPPASSFSPILFNAHYPSIERGLTADILATRALNAQSATVCTSHIVASHGKVTDVLHVPTDTIGAQLEHILQYLAPTAAKIGILGDPASIEVVFDHLETFTEPILWDITLSGPSGEDIISQDGIDTIGEHLGDVDMVSIRLQDAELLAGMEIPSLDDAQVAVQRLVHNGAPAVLLRCGQISTHYFDTDSSQPDYAVDLFHDGDEFALFEAPLLQLQHVHGASSAFHLPLLKNLQSDLSLQDATQQAKRFVTEALRHHKNQPHIAAPAYFWHWQTQTESNGAATT